MWIYCSSDGKRGKQGLQQKSCRVNEDILGVSGFGSVKAQAIKLKDVSAKED